MKIEYFWVGPAELSGLDSDLDVAEYSHKMNLGTWENHILKDYAVTLFNYIEEL